MKSLLLALFTAASFAVDSFGQTVISSVPYHITSPGTYVLGANLTLSSVTGGAIVIRTNHVTLDLAGHYLFNPNPPSSSPLSWGVYVENGANVTIQNGIIVNFFHGVFFTYSTALNSGNVVQNLRLTN
jgi:hypothetical protein